MTHLTLDMPCLTDYALANERLYIYTLYNKMQYFMDLELAFIEWHLMLFYWFLLQT